MAWITVSSALRPGRYFMQGNEACAEGAIAAGCNFYAGYPITPSSEIMHHLARRFLELGGGRVFVQMEDELASIASCIGASWAGAKAMTATSGPGLSLMLENIGYAIMTETPVVIVDVQRAGPSTGQATRPAQGDVMQARFGAHGDYEIIALSPWSVQEMYELTIRAFNLAERFRTPVFLLADEAVAHMRENLSVEGEVRVYNRCKPRDEEPPFGVSPSSACEVPEVPPMPAFGEGHRLLVTGSTHDARGYRRTVSPQAQRKLVERFVGKIALHKDEITEVREYLCEDELDVLLVAYGFTARSALAAARMARREGIRVGLLRLVTLWPFPSQALRRWAVRSRHVLVPEMNRGQILREVQRTVPQARGYHRTDGEVITPLDILEALTGREGLPNSPCRPISEIR